MKIFGMHFNAKFEMHIYFVTIELMQKSANMAVINCIIIIIMSYWLSCIGVCIKKTTLFS